MMTSITPGTRRTQAQRRDAARSAIIDTAVELLGAGGYRNLTLAELGERAGYSRSLAAHYFGSKPKLLIAVVAHVLGHSPLTRLDESLRGFARIDGELAAVFDGLDEDPTSARAYIAITFEAVTSLPELLPVVHHQNVEFRWRLESALRDGVVLGTVRPDVDATAVSIALVAMLRGTVWEWFTDGSIDLAACRRALSSQVHVLCAAEGVP